MKIRTAYLPTKQCCVSILNFCCTDGQIALRNLRSDGVSNVRISSRQTCGK